MDLARLHGPIRAELDRAIGDIVTRGAFILGADVKSFEEEYARYIGTSRAVGVDNGTSALELILRSLGVGPGDEVIVPAFTFVATASAVAMTGAKPVFCDIDLATYGMDAGKAMEKVTPATKAAIPVHLYGYVNDLEPLRKGARGRFAIIEDACQAHGAKLGAKRAGALGTAAAFSFYPSKNLGCFGDGGIITTDSADIADKAAMLRNYGEARKYEHLFLAYNKRLDALQAAVLRVKLPHLDSWNASRQEAAVWYREALRGTRLVLPVEAEPGRHVHYVYAVRSERRDELQKYLKGKGIDSGIHFPFPLHLLPIFRHLGHAEGAYPAAEKAAREIVSLPMFPGITREEVGRVAEEVRAFEKGN